MDKDLLDDLIDYLYTLRDDDDKADELFWRCRDAKRQVTSKDRRYVNRAI